MPKKELLNYFLMPISYKEKKLLGLAIEKLKRLGFIDVNIHTLLEDEVYRSFLIKILKEISLKNKDWEITTNTILAKVGKRR